MAPAHFRRSRRQCYRRRDDDADNDFRGASMSGAGDVQRVHLWISGRVQGVFFRSSTREQARTRGLTGWVRNAPDGRVEAEVQGPPTAVRQLVTECHEGPPGAAVTTVDVEEIAVVPGEEGFQVAR
jgi:acylphosphatase